MTEQLLKGKYAVVTGGTRGIGRAIVERLLGEGATVAFCGRTRESVERASAEMKALGNVFGYAADISKMEDVESFFASVGSRFPGVDVLVNNAGAGRFVSVDQMTPAEWRSVIDLNLSGVFYCCHHGLPLMKKRGGGYVINISSLAGKNPLAGGSAYNASKFGLNGFSEAMMMDVRYQNVRVSYIMPGSVRYRIRRRRGAVGVENCSRGCGRRGRDPAAHAGKDTDQPCGDASVTPTQKIVYGDVNIRSVCADL